MIWNKGEQAGWERIRENIRRMDRGESPRPMSWAEAKQTLENAGLGPEEIEEARRQWVEELGEEER